MRSISFAMSPARKRVCFQHAKNRSFYNCKMFSYKLYIIDEELRLTAVSFRLLKLMTLTKALTSDALSIDRNIN